MLVVGVLGVRDMTACRDVFVGAGVGGRAASAHLASFGVVGEDVDVVIGVVVGVVGVHVL